MFTTHKTYENRKMYSAILLLSAWGFVIVISSFLFLYVGHHLDKLLGTSPNFMFGLFFLALFVCIGRLFQEAWLKQKDV
ncbi:MAG: AtpZ/AtpI family protein [Deltaproteobacteria bacterium]|nr:AtpZ/AtpI family protein [Deltaproteobacteria bacterium]